MCAGVVREVAGEVGRGRPGRSRGEVWAGLGWWSYREEDGFGGSL